MNNDSTGDIILDNLLIEASLHDKPGLGWKSERHKAAYLHCANLLYSARYKIQREYCRPPTKKNPVAGKLYGKYPGCYVHPISSFEWVARRNLTHELIDKGKFPNPTNLNLEQEFHRILNAPKRKKKEKNNARTRTVEN